MKLLRSRLSAGLGTQAGVAMLHAWDSCFNGDGRLTNVAEHYHNDRCGGDDEVCRRTNDKDEVVPAAAYHFLPVATERLSSRRV